jgi:glycosyltransferase involved in cell wall biosynthesis
MNIVGMMRVKNEERWIKESLQSLLRCCSYVFVLDDHSEDDTRAICESFPDVTVYPNPWTGFNEVRDKNFLLSATLRASPKWIICIDGDEVLEPNASQKISQIINESGNRPWCDAYSFRILYLWDRVDTVRVDGLYGRCFRASMFRARQDLYFVAPYGELGLHCGNVPAVRHMRRRDVKIYHYGYLLSKDRERKFDWYESMDKRDNVGDEHSSILAKPRLRRLGAF